MRKTLGLLAAMALLTGCSGEQTEEPKETTPTTGTTAATQPNNTDRPSPTSEDVATPPSDQTNLTFDTPFTYESNGVALTVTDLSIISRESMVKEDPSLDEFFDADIETMFALNMQASNDSGQTINFYPNQGTLKIGREQVDADMLLSDNFAGMDWQDGTDDSGAVVWLLTMPYADAVTSEEATLTVSAPSSADDYSPIADPVELAITWDLPAK